MPISDDDAKTLCSVDECEKPSRAKSLCQTHYTRLRRHGDPLTKHKSGTFGPKNPKWKGGRFVISSGYVVLQVGRDHPMAKPNGYVREHRLVMSEAIGRSLEQHETVHHVNGDRTDNRLENLQLRTSNHGPGYAHMCGDCGSINIVSAELS